jgi:transcriptional regulator with GAF, ATPase, and Fis domain
MRAIISRFAGGETAEFWVARLRLNVLPIVLPSLRTGGRRSDADPLFHRQLDQTRAAVLLGLNRDQIRYRIEKFKLERPAIS